MGVRVFRVAQRVLDILTRYTNIGWLITNHPILVCFLAVLGIKVNSISKNRNENGAKKTNVFVLIMNTARNLGAAATTVEAVKGKQEMVPFRRVYGIPPAE
jgi:hypothetical protein